MKIKQKPWKILYLNPTAKMSGAEFSLLALWRNLDREKFQPLLLLPEEGPFFEVAMREDVKTSIVPSMIGFGESYRLSKIPRILTTLKKIRMIIKNFGVQLIHANSPRVGVMGGVAARVNRIPSLIHVRDIHLSPFTHRAKAAVLDYLSDIIIAVSQTTQKSIISKRASLNRKTIVVYNGVDCEELARIKPAEAGEEFSLVEGAPLLVGVGLLHPAKGFHTLIRACSLVKQAFSQFKLLLVGTYLRKEEKGYQRELEALVKELGLAGNIIFTGFRNDVLALMKRADLIIHPAEYPEPLPRTLLEAGGLGRPVVATQVGGIPEIIVNGETGLLVPPAAHQEMGKAIVNLLKNKDKAEQLGLNAQKKVMAEFNIHQHVAQISEIYLNLLRKK